MNPTLMLADVLSWPHWARSESFKILNTESPILVSNCGVNQLILEEAHSIKDKNVRENVQFEYTVNGYQMHIAMALNSTYIPKPYPLSRTF